MQNRRFSVGFVFAKKKKNNGRVYMVGRVRNCLFALCAVFFKSVGECLANLAKICANLLFLNKSVHFVGYCPTYRGDLPQFYFKVEYKTKYYLKCGLCRTFCLMNYLQINCGKFCVRCTTRQDCKMRLKPPF